MARHGPTPMLRRSDWPRGLTYPWGVSQTEVMAIHDSSLTSRNLLGTSAPDAGGCCGGGGCMCGAGAAGSSGEAEAATASGVSAGLTNAEQAPRAASVSAADPVVSEEFLVNGMTCGHCVASVREEVGAIAGVRDVDVVLKKGGDSRVTVSADGPVDRDVVRAAVEEAGYQLA